MSESTVKTTLHCPEPGCGFSSKSETRFVAHLIDTHAVRPNQVPRILARAEKRAASRRYKVVMVSDGSTVSTGFESAARARGYMRNHKDYRLLDATDWKVVRDEEAR